MKLFKKARKGFTLIELVVVITVMAVLSAVAVVTYISITNKAKLSNDQLKVDQVNLSLTADETLNGKRKTVHETLQSLEDEGFRPENFTAESKGYQFVYVKELNKLALFKDGQLTYPKGVKANQKSDIYLFTGNGGNLKDGYSHYLTGEDIEGEVQVNAGLDVGYNTKITLIDYDRGSESGEQKVVVRSNSFATTLRVNGPEDTVTHYGNAAVVNVEKIASASYHENGTVGRLTVSEGHAVAEKDSVVFCFIDAGDNSVATAEVKSGAKVYDENGEEAGSNAVVSGSHADCGAGHHDFGSALVVDQHVYEVCKSCGYTLVTIVDIEGNESKTTMVDANDSVVTTPVETYNSTATNSEGQVIQNKEEPVVESPTISEKTDKTCIHEMESTVVTESTCTHTGLKLFTCKNCGMSYTSIIPMKAHTYYDNIGGVHSSTEHCAVCGHERGDKVAKIGNVEYTTLTDAIAAVPHDGTQTLITLVNDDAIEGNAGWTIAADQSIVLDLNGYTLKNLVNEDKVSQVIKNLGTLVIKDSSDLNKDGTGTGLIFNQAKADVHVGEWYGDIQYNYQTAVIINHGNFTFNSGRLLQTAVGSIEYCIDTLTNGTSYNPVVTINGGAMQNHYSNAIRMFCNSTTNENILTINGGVIRGYCAVWMQNPSSNSGRGKLTINGGTFYTEANAYLNGSKTISKVGSSIYNTDGSNHASNMYLTITGGEFFENIEWCGSTSHCTITGGTFHGYVDVYSEDATITGGTFYDAYDDPISSYVGYYKEDGNFYGGGSSNITWSLEDWENNGYTVLLASETGHKYYYLTSYPQYIGRDDGNCRGYTMASWMRSYSSTEITDLEGYYDIISPAYRHLDDLPVSEGYELIADSNNYYKVVAK